MARDVGSALVGSIAAAFERWPLVGRSTEISQLRTSISGRRGAVIVGPAGVGKTALATLGLEFGRERGMAVALVSGTAAARPYPFGAFASLLHRDSDLVGPESHADQLRRYMHELLDDAGPRPLLVLVDDAHLLDDGSASLVHQLVLAGAATVLACVHSSPRPAQPGPDPMVVLWKDYGAARIELGPLDGPAVEDLLLAVLGGPIDTVSLRQIAERSLGDPLFLHELVTGALDNGSLREESGIWRLRGPLQPTARLVDLVTTRLGNLSDAERHALELSALGGPLAQPALDKLADPAALESLEDRGLLASRMDGRRLQIRLAHPVYGDVLRSGLSPRRQRVLAQELAEAAGGRRQDDTLLRSAAARRRRRKHGPSGARRQGRPRASRLRARRTPGSCGHGERRRVRGATPRGGGGLHERATRAGRSGAPRTGRGHNGSRGAGSRVSLVCFDHDLLWRGGGRRR